MSKPYTWVEGISDAMRVRELGVVAVALQGGEPVVLEIPKDDPRVVPIHDGLQLLNKGECCIVGVDSIPLTVGEADVVLLALEVCRDQLKEFVAKTKYTKRGGRSRKNLEKLEAVHESLRKRLRQWSSVAIKSAKGGER